MSCNYQFLFGYQRSIDDTLRHSILHAAQFPAIVSIRTLGSAARWRNVIAKQDTTDKKVIMQAIVNIVSLSGSSAISSLSLVLKK